MCGLIYGKRRDNRSVVKSLLKRYDKQSGRGTQGFGYVVIKNGHVVDIKRSKYEAGIKSFLNQEDGASEIMFHHRFPTSTENLEEVTHPIVVSNDLLDSNYYVIHNGVLTNEDVLKEEYEKMGFKYTTDIVKTTIVKIAGITTSEDTTVGFNDSESFAIDLALFLDGKKNIIESVGSIAFICIQTDKNDKVQYIHYGRNDGNPLVMEDNNDLFFLKSMGGGTDIKEDVINSIDYETGKTIQREVKIGTRWTAGFGSVAGWGHRHRSRDDDEKEYTVIPVKTDGEGTTQIRLLKEGRDFRYQEEYHGYSSAFSDEEYARKAFEDAQKQRDDVTDEISTLQEGIKYGEDQITKPNLSSNDVVILETMLKEDKERLKERENTLNYLNILLDDDDTE